jgi:F0F1-type ATP synthase assembly protein I
LDGGPGLGDLLSLGATLASCLVLGFGAGWLVDRAGGTFPIFALVGLALGVVAACFSFYKTFKRYSGGG